MSSRPARKASKKASESNSGIFKKSTRGRKASNPTRQTGQPTDEDHSGRSGAIGGEVDSSGGGTGNLNYYFVSFLLTL